MLREFRVRFQIWPDVIIIFLAAIEMFRFDG